MKLGYDLLQLKTVSVSTTVTFSVALSLLNVVIDVNRNARDNFSTKTVFCRCCLPQTIFI